MVLGATTDGQSEGRRLKPYMKPSPTPSLFPILDLELMCRHPCPLGYD
jgi:hypothetical protein